MPPRLRRPVWIVLLLVVLAATAAAGLARFAHAPGPGQGREVVVLIQRGSGVGRIATQLAQQGLIRSETLFLLLTWLPGQPSAGLKAGEYLLRDDLTPLALLRLLRAGQVLRHRLTVPEGSSLQQVAERLSAFDWLDRELFLSLSRDQALLTELDVEGGSAEGYLFPDTYHLIRGVDDETALLRRMTGRFHVVWRQLTSTPPQRPLDRQQALTLASMVEKETGHGPERPLVAAVFLNRLQRGMRLQSDPTVIYGLERFDGNLTRSHLTTPSPYNTYTLPALPAGPICSPGRAALESVLNPAASDALFFVSRNDGSHHFSRSLQEHNQAVRRYQKAEGRGQKTDDERRDRARGEG